MSGSRNCSGFARRVEQDACRWWCARLTTHHPGSVSDADCVKSSWSIASSKCRSDGLADHLPSILMVTFSTMPRIESTVSPYSDQARRPSIELVTLPRYRVYLDACSTVVLHWTCVDKVERTH